MPYNTQSQKEMKEVAESFKHILKKKLAYTTEQMLLSEMRVSGVKRQHIVEYIPHYYREIGQELLNESEYMMKFNKTREASA